IYIVNNGKLEAVRQGAWKYREVPAGINHISTKQTADAKELFNINYDPSERTNVIEEHPEKAKELKALFDGFTGDKKN
ncbi:MAG TPA: hypothetical protein VM187_04300, partial [Niastella sp.]|nr:hypothetical protein [Niastella sp.]